MTTEETLPRRRFGPNPIAAGLLTPAERRAELCAILALGLVRLLSRQSSGISADTENSSLDLARDQSGHAIALKRRI